MVIEEVSWASGYFQGSVTTEMDECTESNDSALQIDDVTFVTYTIGSTTLF